MPKKLKVDKSIGPSKDEIQEAVEKCLTRISGPTEASYLRIWLSELVKNRSIPIGLLEYLPAPSKEIGKTRFDQLYDAAIALVFPEYTKSTIERLLGPSPDPNIKIWRVVLPDRYQITHVLIRAESYAQAFALGCDYTCRMSLRLYGKIPLDMTIRVMYMGERALRRYLDMRWANRTARRRKFKQEGREVSPKQLRGARLCALGSPRSPYYSIARYCEQKDLNRIRLSKNLARESAVESESFRRK